MSHQLSDSQHSDFLNHLGAGWGTRAMLQTEFGRADPALLLIISTLDYVLGWTKASIEELCWNKPSVNELGAPAQYACCLPHWGRHWINLNPLTNTHTPKPSLVGRHARGCLQKLFPSFTQAKNWLTWISHRLAWACLACTVLWRALCPMQTCCVQRRNHPTHCWGLQSLCAGCFIS